jgi:hypothetical protein
MEPDLLAKAAAIACGTKFRIWGGEGERQDNPADNDAEDDQNPKDDDKSGNRGSGNADDIDDDNVDDDSDAGKAGEKSLQDQLDELKRDNLTLKKSNDQLKAGKKKADADKDAAAERDEAVAERDTLKTLLDTKFLAWSIQTFTDGKTKYDWIDIEDVAGAVNKDAIDIDLKTGEVKGLDLELKRIAKKKPHWLKKDDDDDEQSPSGGHPVGGKTKTSELDNAKIGEKYKIPGYGSQNLRVM